MYPTQQGYYTGAPAPYSQPMPSRAIPPAPYPYNYAAAPGPSVTEAPEGAQPPQPYTREYTSAVTPAAASQRGDSYYYPQSTTTETPYGHQYMPFRQVHLGPQYTEPGQPSSPHLSTCSSSSQRPNSPDRRANDPHSRRIDEVRYNSVSVSFLVIDSTAHSFLSVRRWQAIIVISSPQSHKCLPPPQPIRQISPLNLRPLTTCYSEPWRAYGG